MDFLDTPNTPDLAPEAQDGNGAPTESSLLETPVELPPPVTPQLETPQQKFERLEAEASVQPGSKVSSVDGPSELLADIANDIAKEEMLLGEMECEGSMARLPPLPKAVETPSKKDIQRKVAINVGKDLGYDIVGAQDRVPKPIGAVAPNLWAERVKGGTPDPKAAPPKQIIQTLLALIRPLCCPNTNWKTGKRANKHVIDLSVDKRTRMRSADHWRTMLWAPRAPQSKTPCRLKFRNGIAGAPPGTIAHVTPHFQKVRRAFSAQTCEP